LYKWRDHFEVDATWRPWNHEVNHGSHKHKLNDIEEKMIEEALNELSAGGEKMDRKLGQMVVRPITLETRGVWVEMSLSSLGRLMHRLGFTPRAAHAGAATWRTRTQRLHSRPPWMTSFAGPRFNPGILINLDETAIRIHGGRNMTSAKTGADGVLIDSAGSPRDCMTVLAGCSFDASLLQLCFVAKGEISRCHQGFGNIAPTGSHTPT
jgi:hypothetical protein